MTDDNNFNSDLYDDEDDLFDAHGNDFSLGGALVDEEEEDPDLKNKDSVNTSGRWPPRLDRWSDQNAHSVHPKISFNGASKFAYEQAKKEVAYLVGQIGRGEDGVKKLFQKCFGDKSELFLKCHEHLNMSYSEFCGFLATFLFECKFGKTYSRLCEEKYVDTSDFATEEQYKEWWKMIDEYNKSERFLSRFWEIAQLAFNNTMQKVFQPTNCEYKIYVTIDDDKQHYNFHICPRNVPLSDTNKIKRVRFFRDNVTGQALDVAVFTASGLPVCAKYRTKGQDTAFKEIVQTLFNFSDTEDAPNLSEKVVFLLDRGYWTANLVLYAGNLGADVVGTFQRMPAWFPLTFGHTEPKTQKRGQQFIVCGGPMSIHWRLVSHSFERSGNDFRMSAWGFRNGRSSSVALMGSSLHHDYGVDAKISKASAAKRYEECLAVEDEEERHEGVDNLMRGFELIVGSDPHPDPMPDDTMLSHPELLTRHVTPLTEGYCEEAWRVMRRFSLTSSTTARVIRAKAPSISPDHALYGDYGNVLHFAGLDHLLQEEEGEGVGEEEMEEAVEEESSVEDISIDDSLIDECISGTTREQATEEDFIEAGHQIETEEEWEALSSSDSSGLDVDDMEESDVINAWAEEFVDMFCGSDQGESFEKLRRKDGKAYLQDAPDDVMLAIIDRIEGAKRMSSAEERRRILIEWVDCTRVERVVKFMTLAEMKAFHTRHGGLPNISWSGKVDTVRERLAGALKAAEDEGVQDDDDDLDEGVFTGDYAVATEVARSSFMKPVRGGSDEGQAKYLALGHRAEKVQMEQAHDLYSRKEGGVTSIEAMYSPGLVHAYNHFFLRGTADGVAIFNLDGVEDRYAVPVECKCRASPSSWSRERNRIDDLRRENAFQDVGAETTEFEMGTHKALLVEMEVRTPEQLKVFHKCVPDVDERLQLLHHAAVYKCTRCIFLIGNDTSLMVMYIFRFPTEAIKIYRRICQGIYTDDLKWIYAPGPRVPSPPRGWLEAFRKSKALKYLKMDRTAFMTAIGIWRALNINVENENASESRSTTILYPLPPIIRFDPDIVSLWNVMKGGGDTMTDLLDRFQEKLGQRSENNVATARILLYFAIAQHRGNQWCTADSEFRYPTLTHCRNANNQRYAFEDSIDMLIEMLMEVVRAEKSQSLLDATTCAAGVDSKETPLPMEHFTLLPPGADAANQAAHEKERRPARNPSKQRTPQAPGLPAPSVVSGRTPRTTTQKPVKTHEDRCKQCLGIYPAKVVSIGIPTNVQGKKKKKGKTDDRIRRLCAHCGKKTDFMCLGCRRFCCISAPSAAKSGKKHPNHFSVQTPMIDRKTGRLRRKKKSGDMVYETAVCAWTCFHALHREAWATYTESNKHQILALARGERSGVDRKARRKMKKLKTIKEGEDEDNSEAEVDEEESDDSESSEESGSESDSGSGSDDDSDSDPDEDDRIAIQSDGRKRSHRRMSR